MTVRVVVADDQELVREGFRLILEAQDDIEVVGEAADGAAAVEVARRTQPDVVLMDIRMPLLDGITATRRLLTGPGPRPKVLVLTTFDLDQYVHEALRAGASGFLLKDSPRRHLLHAVRSAADGDALLDPGVVRRLVEEFLQRPPPGCGVPAAFARLTERELDVVREVAVGRSNAEVAAALHLSETTVKSHVAHVLQKTGMRDRVQLVVLAYESGLVRPGG